MTATLVAREAANTTPARTTLITQVTGSPTLGSGTTTYTIAHPTGIVTGDLEIIALVASAAPTATPSGFTVVNSGGSPYRYCAYRLYSGQAAPFFSFSSAPSVTGRLVAYHGVDQTTPVSASTVNFTSGSSFANSVNNVTHAAINVPDANSLLVAVLDLQHTASGYTETVPNGFTSVAGTGSSGSTYNVAIASMPGPTNATGSSTQAKWSISASITTLYGQLLAIKSA